MAEDTFDTYSASLSGPADDCAAVTPSDSTDLPTIARALYVGGGGDLVITTKVGSTVTFADVPAGSLLPVRARRVRATGTGATNIVALW